MRFLITPSSALQAILATDPFPLLLPFVTETGIEYGDRRRLNTLVLLHSIVCSALKHPESTAATETVLMQLAEEVIDEAITKYNLVSEMVNNILPQENTMIVDICLDLAAKAVERDNKKILAVFDPSANIVSNLVYVMKISCMTPLKVQGPREDSRDGCFWWSHNEATSVNFQGSVRS